MHYTDILRMKRELKPFHKFNLFNRLLEASNNNLLIVFNNFKNAYEIHSVRSHQMSDDSQNALFRRDEWMNGFIIHELMANTLRKFAIDIQSERMRIDTIYNNLEDSNLTESITEAGLKSIERAWGRKI
jgi:hypothetical protein